MAGDGTSTMKMSDITQCSICLEAYKEPKALPCIHTFCLQCLDQHCQDKVQEEVTCPLCRKAFTIPPGGIVDLPNNFFILQLLQVKQPVTLKNKNANKQAVCELCSDSDSETSSYCVECAQDICDRCAAIHVKSNASRFHSVISDDANVLNSKKRIKLSISYCDRHAGEQNRLYCNDCKTASCHFCFLDVHNGHRWVDVNQSDEMLRKLLNNDIENVSACALKKQEHMNRIDIAEKNFIDDINTAECEIYKKYDTLISLVLSHKNHLLEKLIAFRNRILQDVEIEKEEVEKQFALAESFKLDCQEVANENAARDISSVVHDLHARAEELVKIRNESDGHRLIGVEVTFKPSWHRQLSLRTIDGATNFIGELIFKDPIEFRDARALDFTRFPERLTALHVASNNLDEHVYGVTVLHGELFVVRDASLVNIYDADDYAFIRSVTITGAASLKSVVSCSIYNCLYFGDDAQKSVYRYDLASSVTSYWSIGGVCYELSLTKARNVLATLFDTRRIQEYSTYGALIREISLESSIDEPSHCVQLSTGNYVVSNTGTQHRVCIVDQGGRVVRSYGGYPGSREEQMCYPFNLAVDAYDNILVTDCYNNRVLLLSRTLTYLGDVAIAGHDINEPLTLHVDDVNRRLYIVECRYGRMFALDVNVGDDS